VRCVARWSPDHLRRKRAGRRAISSPRCEPSSTIRPLVQNANFRPAFPCPRGAQPGGVIANHGAGGPPLRHGGRKPASSSPGFAAGVRRGQVCSPRYHTRCVRVGQDFSLCQRELLHGRPGCTRLPARRPTRRVQAVGPPVRPSRPRRKRPQRVPPLGGRKGRPGSAKVFFLIFLPAGVPVKTTAAAPCVTAGPTSRRRPPPNCKAAPDHPPRPRHPNPAPIPHPPPPPTVGTAVRRVHPASHPALA